MLNRANLHIKHDQPTREEPGRLPYRVGVMLLLQHELQKTSLDLAKIDSLINQDPALAAIVLARANRVLPRGIACVAQGLALMDTSMLAALFEKTATTSYTSKLARGFPAAEWCDYSVQVAKVSRSLAIDIGYPGALAYTAGLMHATGELVMHLYPRGEVRELDTHISPFHLYRRNYEIDRLGYSYSLFSSRLAERWGLPSLLVKAIEHHEDPFASENFHPLTSLLHLAVWRVRATWDRHMDVSEASLNASYPAEVALALGLDMDMVLQKDGMNWMDAWRESA